MTSAPSAISTDVSELEDSELAALVATGSAEALEALYQRYSRVVMSFSTRMMGDRLSGEELVQEVFLKAWRQSHAYSASRGTYVTWLLSITHNLAIDEIRKRNRRPQRADSADPVLMLTNVTDESMDTEATAELNQVRSVIDAAIKTLPRFRRKRLNSLSIEV